MSTPNSTLEKPSRTRPPAAAPPRRRRLRILITAKKRAWCGELYTIVLGANGLGARGHHVVVAHNVDSAVVRHLDPDKVWPVAVDFRRGLLRWPTAVRSRSRLRGLIRSLEIDVVEVHSSWDHWLAATALVGLRHGPPLVRFRHNRKRILRHPPNRWLYHATARFAAQTEYVREDILSTSFVPGSRVTVLGSAIDLGRFGPDADARKAVRSELGIPPDAPVIGYVGRLSERKRPGRLLDVYHRVCVQHADAWLVVVGWGEDEHAALVRRAANANPRVCHLGKRDDPERIYPAFDVFVLPSYAESFPRAALEAMASGVVTVTGNDSGLRGFVDDGMSGRVLEDDGAESLAAAVTDLLGSPVAAARMAESGRRLVSTTLTTDAYVDRLERFLLDAAARGGNGAAR